jgi:hypothetical protein
MFLSFAKVHDDRLWKAKLTSFGASPRVSFSVFGKDHSVQTAANCLLDFNALSMEKVHLCRDGSDVDITKSSQTTPSPSVKISSLSQGQGMLVASGQLHNIVQSLIHYWLPCNRRSVVP